MKRALFGALLTFWASAGATDPQTPDDAQTFSLDQARGLARQALYAGRFDLARDVAMVLVRTDPEDAYAYGVLAAAHSRLDDPKLARAAARLSYKYSETPAEKFGAARTAASVAHQQERHTISQGWLRLAATHVDTAAQEKALKQDYGRVRAANPLRFNINLSVAPSDNVNNGTDNVILINNGIPTNTAINGNSRALSGTVGTFDGQLRYRLSNRSKSRTTASGRLYVRRVVLSSEAERLLKEDAASRRSDPETNSDFNETFAEVGIEHLMALGAPGNTLTFGATLGAKWSADEQIYESAKLRLSRTVKLSDSTRLFLSGSTERRFSTFSNLRDVDVVTVGATVSHKLQRGDTLSVGLNLSQQDGHFANTDVETASLRANYTFGKQLGPVQISTGLTFGYTDFDDYRLGNTIPGGRQDESLYGDISLFFADYDFAGFAPTIKLRTGRKSSNINRFEIDETTITLGIQSKF